MSTVREQLAAATAEQADLLAKVEATEDERARLGGLQEQSTRLSAEGVVLERARSATTEFANRLTALRSTDGLLESWVAGQQEPDEYRNARAQIEQAAARVTEAQAAAMAAIESLQALFERNQHERAQVEDDSRHLRARLNSLQEGAGNITRRVDGLREQLGQLESVQELLQSRTASVAELAAERSAIFDEVDRLRDTRFEGRRNVGERLNVELGPRINVSLRRSGEKSAYVSAIIAGLRGSGLHYNDLAPQLADALTPLELVDCVDTSDIERLATLAEIPTNRAAAVIQQLQAADLGDIISAPIEDTVELFLLDGSEYKPTSHLSIGQRCTVVLPLLLSRHGDALIVDQPEDHIDNAFITSTLVSTLRSRLSTDQFIFSSHNANIPVLGEADNVIHLESDGRRGFARSHGSLDDPATVEAISHVMEGGPEAFAAHAEFYASGRTSSSLSHD